MLAIERRDSVEARRLARTFPSVDTLRTSRIGTTGLRMVTRAVVLAELGDVRQALAVLELIDPARFSLSESVETTWAVYVRQFMLRGALYERIGEQVKARQAYERFLELWRDGEAPLEPRADGLPAEYVLVCPSTDPAWVPLLARGAKALVMETGGVLSHGAIVAREFGLPAVAGPFRAGDALLPRLRGRLRDGQPLRIDGGKGTVTLLPG